MLSIPRRLIKYNTCRHVSTLIPEMMEQYSYTPHKICKADGCYLYKETQPIMDFTSGLMVVNLGHNNEYIMEGFKEHMKTGISYVNSQFETYQRDYLSCRLLNHANMTGKVFYTTSGTDANKIAVSIVNDYHKKMSYNLTKKKKKILTFEKLFHSESIIEKTNDKTNEKTTLSGNDFHLIQNPIMRDAGESSLCQIETLCKHEDIAAIIVEGASGLTGCMPYPENYLKALNNLCKKYNVLIICDEIMSSWGRTGSIFAYTKHGIKPDIITTSHGLTSGYVPLGATIISADIANIYKFSTFSHGSTYFAHPLSCTIANKCIDLYTKNNFHIINKINRKGQLLNKLGTDMCIELDIIKNYHNYGLLGCFELNNHNDVTLKQISDKLLNNGIFCYRRKNLIFTAPPLIIKKYQMEEAMYIIKKTLQDYY